MACRGTEETVVNRGPVVNPGDLEIVSTGHPKDTSVIFGNRAPGTAQRASMPMSSLFNHGDPDLSFCDVLAAYPIETESDQPPTVDVEEFTDLMLFPDLMGVLEENMPGSFQDLPLDPMGGVGEPLKPRDVISSVSDGGEISPAESDASVDHFFNTFTDLTGFLQQLTEETGPTDLTDLATSIAGSNDPLTTDAEPSAMATTTLPTPVGSETACKEEECSPRRPAPSSDDDDDDMAPPTKKARTSRHNASAKSAEQKYRQRRDKNNVASQRSRATRKQREGEMVVKAKELEAENARLRVRIDELTLIAEEARKCLVVSLSQK